MTTVGGSTGAGGEASPGSGTGPPWRSRAMVPAASATTSSSLNRRAFAGPAATLLERDEGSGVDDPVGGEAALADVELRGVWRRLQHQRDESDIELARGEIVLSVGHTGLFPRRCAQPQAEVLKRLPGPVNPNPRPKHRYTLGFFVFVANNPDATASPPDKPYTCYGYDEGTHRCSDVRVLDPKRLSPGDSPSLPMQISAALHRCSPNQTVASLRFLL